VALMILRDMCAEVRKGHRHSDHTCRRRSHSTLLTQRVTASTPIGESGRRTQLPPTKIRDSFAVEEIPDVSLREFDSFLHFHPVVAFLDAQRHALVAWTQLLGQDCSCARRAPNSTAQDLAQSFYPYYLHLFSHLR
jgi:hypothetical protein